MNPRRLPIARPCDEDWNTMRPGGEGRHCAACATTVVDLSSMTERDARRSLDRARARGSESLCVRYVVGADGEVEFRSPPPGRGVREWAVGLGLGLASLVGGAASARADASVAPCGSSAAAGHAAAPANAHLQATNKPHVPTPPNDPPPDAHAPRPRRHALMGKMTINHDPVDDVLAPKP